MATAGPLPFLVLNGAELCNAARTISYLRGGLGNTMSGRWELGAGQLCGVLYRQYGGTGSVERNASAASFFRSARVKPPETNRAKCFL